VRYEVKDENEPVIFVKWFRHWRTGKIIRPKNGKVIVIHLKHKVK
jgi:hypothetical protein